MPSGWLRSVVACVLIVNVICVHVPPLPLNPQTRPRTTDPCVHDSCGQRLYLTPLLAAGQVSTAQQRAKVSLPPYSDSYDSYSGYFTVNASTASNLFFWYLPAQNGNANAPLLMWLQGGPGASSLFGLFGENGPVEYTLNGTLKQRAITWNAEYSMLYFDSPVGAGFSFTNSSAGYTTTEDQVAAQLYNALTQFFVMFPDQLKNDFYATGESYGGKYVPAIAYKIHTENAALQRDGAARLPGGFNKQAIKLKGLTIGDGWCDPASQVPTYPSSMFNQGLVDYQQQSIVSQHMDTTMELVGQGKYVEAYEAWDAVWGDYPLGYPSLFTNWTGSTDTTNFLRTETPAAYVAWGSLVNTAAFHRGVHAGAQPFGVNGGLVYYNMRSDFMHSISPVMAPLLDNYKVLVYNGQVDPILGPHTGEAWMASLTWSGSKAWPDAPRTVWRVTGTPDVGGFVKCVGSVYLVVVRGAGHFVPADQPARAYDMITRFVNDETVGFCDAV